MKSLFSVLCVILLLIVESVAQQDPGWPREITKHGAKLVYYQPQVDEWKDYKELNGRMAASLTQADGKQAVGVISFRMQTTPNVDAHTVLLSKMEITKTYFPSQDPETAAHLDHLVRSFLPPDKTLTISLDRLVASVNKEKQKPAAVPVKNDPPPIYVSEGPAILLIVEEKPVKSAIKDTKLETVVNSNWPLFFDKKSSKYFLFTGKLWATAPDLQGQWTPVEKLPKDMEKVAADPNFADLKKFIPPPASGPTQLPRVYYSNVPADLILFQGQPVYSAIPSTQLVYASNSESDVFVYSPTKTYYYLTAGRWFSAASLSGPWTFATPNLPEDFSRIPSNSPASRVLASVPGTPEAADAVLLAQVPTKVVVNPAEAAKQVKVNYSGEPQFKPIENTSLQYAVNTQDKVIKSGDLYYACYQGIWFVSTSPQGPWETAKSVPQEIYSIPPSSPVYNVTYVTQTTTDKGDVEASYTAGYLGAFVMGVTVGAIVTSGTGYYYPPYYGWYGGYPVYYGRPVTYGGWYGGYGYGGAAYGAYGGARWGAGYNPYTGNYVRGGAAYGPYGAARGGSAYNPYTGTVARGGTAVGPGGSRSAAQAYNPYTGGYAATRQGSSPYSQWGSSVVSRNGQSAYTQHASNARGSVGSVQTSSGGRAVGAAGAGGSAVAGKSASGDLYAGRDGNVYRNTGGGWQTYNNGSWNNVEKPNTSTAQQNAANRTTNVSERSNAMAGQSGSSLQRQSGADTQNLNTERQNRERGAQSSQRFESSQRNASSGGFRSGGGRAAGGFGGRGRR
ncbi:MAG TPA: hypothetical protein VMU24_04175 [Candidatus Acidoferrales bacterium]|nr:hypothetical protein [Candidatus Acidoferrales bacterium]